MSEENKEIPKENDQTFEKLKKEKDNYREALQREREEKERLTTLLKQKEEEELKLKENYKEIASIKEREALDWKSKFETREKELVDVAKLSQVKKELEKMGAQNSSVDALIKLADLNQVKYDPETRVVYNADLVAKSIKEALPQAFGVPSEKVDESAPKITDVSSLDIEGFSKLSLKEKKEKQFELMKAMGLQLRK